MAPHSSTLVWKIPWAEEPGRLQSMGSQRVRHDWATWLSLFTFMHWRRKWQPTPVFLPGNTHGQRSLAGYSAAAAAKSLQSCPTLCDPMDISPPGSPSLGFSRQEHWSGLPFPSPMHECEKWKWSRSVVSDSLRLHGLQPTRLLHPWDFPGKSTGVGCHCLLRNTH